MRKLGMILLCFLLTARLSYSQSDSVKVPISAIINANLTADSLDECKEINDSLQSKISTALQAITAGQDLNTNLSLQIQNRDLAVKERESQVKFEQGVSSAYRKKYTLWKILAFVSMGLNVYQIVR